VVFEEISCYLTSKLVYATTWYIPCFLKETDRHTSMTLRSRWDFQTASFLTL